jgi:hypothetical protein
MKILAERLLSSASNRNPSTLEKSAQEKAEFLPWDQ